MTQPYRVLLTTANNLEGLLLEEAAELGLRDGQQTRGAVQGLADREAIYRLLLGSRLASRLLLPVANVPADEADRFYDALRALPWESYLRLPLTLAVHCHGRSNGIRHTRFGAQRTKDAVVDRARAGGHTVTVDRETPDIRLSVRLRNERAEVALDLSGESMHRRGYRRAGSGASIKEPLAAAVLMRAGWPERARQGRVLFDPCCGAGTLLAEGAMMAADMAPGLLRERFGLSGWLDHDATSWQACRDRLSRRVERDPDRLPRVVGRDRDPKVIGAAEANLDRLGVPCQRELAVADATDPATPWPDGEGVMVTNPPYGHRLSTDDHPAYFYQHLGERARRELPGWRVAVLGDCAQDLSAMGLQSRRVYHLYNGQRACRLGVYDIYATPAEHQPRPPDQIPAAPELRNRLVKNARHLARWRRRGGITCYRVYQADMPEYPFAVDVYETETGTRAHVTEYDGLSHLPARKARSRRGTVVTSVAERLDVDADHVHLATRRSGSSQPYPEERAYEVIREGAARLRVALDGDPDTGLLPHHRLLRARLYEAAANQRFLNLFAHTGAATVQAALGGASATTSIDPWPDHGEWIRANLALNGKPEGPSHEIATAPVSQWLRTAVRKQRRWDIALVAPPVEATDGQGPFELQRDHVQLLRVVASVVASGGWLYFTTQGPDFELDEEALAALQPQEITRETVPRDYHRGSPPHRCWCLRQAA